MLIDNGKVIVEESDLVETFNGQYINIVEKSSGQKLCLVTLFRTLIYWKKTWSLTKIVQYYSNRPSVFKVRDT